jgi:pimeloyl-ACP methyl ester carboxylesterase
MPILEQGSFQIDYVDEGRGSNVVLIHSSVSGNRQWRALGAALSDRYRVLAPNLFGYGATTAWPSAMPQSLYAQAMLIVALCAGLSGTIHLVGHSFGGAVALKAAELLGARVGRLVLLEPNPFHLLRQAGRTRALEEALALRDHVKCFGALGDWRRAAERFADYWLGNGAWAAMPENRRAAFAASLPPNVHEWDALMGEVTPVERWRDLGVETLLVCDPHTRPPTREVADILLRACPRWTLHTLCSAGHMAPLTRPDLVNPLVGEFLDKSEAAPAAR